MTCPNCGNNNENNINFCTNCGVKLNSNTPQKKSKKMIIIIILLVILIAGVVVSVLLLKKDKPNTNQNITSTTTTSTSTTTTTKVVDADGYPMVSDDTIGKVDTNTNLVYDKDGAFLLYIDDIYQMSNKGTVVTGTVIRGTITAGDIVQVIGYDNKIITTVASRVEKFQRIEQVGYIGEEVTILLKGINKDEISLGQAVVKPNSIVISKKIDIEIPMTDDFNYLESNTYDITPSTFDIGYKVNVSNVVKSDNTIKMTLEFVKGIPVEVGMNLKIRENNSKEFKGKVVKLY